MNGLRNSNSLQGPLDRSPHEKSKTYKKNNVVLKDVANATMLSWLLSLPFAVVVVSIPANIRSYCAVAPQGTLSSSASYKQYQKHARRFLHTLEDGNSAIPL
jgi:hypothetical protein